MSLVSWKRLILGCVIGNILELYDFILYAYFSSIIGISFFPEENESVSQLIALSVFATGCLMRPIGSILFGWIGDKHGRKRSLLLSVLLMATSTFFIGILPTYNSIGLLAPTLLIISRLIQGLSMCGEEVGASIYLMESAPKEKRCFSGSIILGSVYLGLFVASIISFIVIKSTDEADLIAWGWRIPFLISLPLGIIAFYVRKSQPESIKFIAIKKEGCVLNNPFLFSIKFYSLSIIKGILTSALLAVLVYLFAVYCPSYLSKNLNLGLSKSMLISATSFLFTTFVSLLTGFLCDKFHHKIFMCIGCFSTILLAPVFFSFLHSNNIIYIVISQIIIATLVGLIAGSLMPLLVGSFPTQVNFTCTSISFNLSMTIFGSSAPIIFFLLFSDSNSIILPSFYMMAIAFIVFIINIRTCEKETSALVIN